MNKKLEARRLADLHMIEILRLLDQAEEENPTSNLKGLIIATYTPEEYAELKPGEDYELFKLTERYVIEDLAAEGIKNVFFQPVDSVEYYKFIAEQNLENNPASISYFANITFIKNLKGLKK